VAHDAPLARHIAHILCCAHDQLRKRELEAQGFDVNTRGLTLDKLDWGSFHACLMTILDVSVPERSLDRPGISD
jgi:hypothetical protein